VQPCVVVVMTPRLSTEQHSSKISGQPTTTSSSEPAAAAVSDAAIDVGQDKPRWLTDLVMRTVWGPNWAQTIWMTTTTTANIPNIPHLIIGNYHEVMFGLTWLDVFFCSELICRNAETLKRLGVPAQYKAVPSDHWRILGSRHLGETLRSELLALLVRDEQRQK
jgi:hypothetical protein